MKRPQGRPLAEHIWRDGGWYHTVTGEPFNQDVYFAGVRRRQAECERRRYWDSATGTRQRRLLRSMRAAASRPRKRRTAMQLTLQDEPRSVAQLPRVLKVFAHTKRDAANDTPELRSEGGGMDSAC